MSEERHGPLPVHGPGEGTNGLRWRRRIAFAVFAAGAAYFLVTEHLAHTIQALPWLILLMCPLMHVFLHGGHGRHSGGDDSHGHGSPGNPR